MIRSLMEGKKLTVVVVEDESLLLKAIEKKLTVSNITPMGFLSGQEALSYLQSNPIPDAIWLDYYLKDMNGLMFMMELKKNPKLADIPVIVVSNSASPDSVHNVLSLGVKKYVLKSNAKLEEIIKDVITLAEERV